jgi:hypothetical protein
MDTRRLLSKRKVLEPIRNDSAKLGIRVPFAGSSLTELLLKLDIIE